MKSIVIFGGAGFIGRHIIRRLAKNGYKIIVPYQQSTKEEKLRFLGYTGQIIPVYYNNLKDKKIISILEKIDVCINLKTTWDSNATSFHNSIFKFNEELADILKSIKKLKQFLYFSGLGIDKDKKSLRSIAIHKSENLFQSNFNNSFILRPGIVIGGEDPFISKLVSVFKMSIIVPIFGTGNSKIQPVYIDDISLLVEKIINKNYHGKHIVELVGPNIFNIKELYELIIKTNKKKRLIIKIPMTIAKILVRIGEFFSISPINLEQLRLFSQNNIKQNIDKEFTFFSIYPQDTKEIISKTAKF